MMTLTFENIDARKTACDETNLCGYTIEREERSESPKETTLESRLTTAAQFVINGFAAGDVTLENALDAIFCIYDKWPTKPNDPLSRLGKERSLGSAVIALRSTRAPDSAPPRRGTAQLLKRVAVVFYRLTKEREKLKSNRAYIELDGISRYQRVADIMNELGLHATETSVQRHLGHK